MGLFDDLFKKKGNQEKISIGGKDYQINPDAMIFSQAGLDKYNQQDYGGAINFFTKAIAADSNNHSFFTMRGTAFEDIGNDVDAEKDFRKAFFLDSTDFIAAYRLAFVFHRKNDLTNAIKWLKISHEKSPGEHLQNPHLGTNNILYVARKIIAGNLGNFLTQIKSYDEGFVYLDEAIKLDANYPTPYFSKGLALAQMNRVNEGLKYLETAEELGHPQATAAINLLKSMVSDTYLDFVFRSSDHLRYENGMHVAGPHGGARRAVKVEPNINGGTGLSVTMYNLDGSHPIWQNNVQMAPKQMRITHKDDEKVMLRGYGQDAMGASFADYGLTILLKGGDIDKCVLHMYDRGVDIVYLS